MHGCGQALRGLFASSRCEQLLEAHNALSATIAEAAGFPGIWASSLTLSCSYGLRDNSELTMTQVLDILDSMTDRVETPILFDGDTGYGSFAHFQQLVRRLCARRVAGVCIEDKVFPKQNSFIGSERQQLAPVEEFCGKLQAGKDAQTDPGFTVVARTEALVTGLGVDEALERAGRYAEAGADAILVHSKDPTFAPVQAFMRRWGGAVPVICVPTTYYGTPPEAFQQAGVSAVIWANHMLRAAVLAMERIAGRIRRAGSARDVEELIAPVGELFRLQDAERLSEMERLYARGAPRRAVVLAASRGNGLEPLTRDRPKCMIPIGGVPALEKQLQHLRAEGIRDISVVRGYRPEAIQPDGVTLFDNPDWEAGGELGSLFAARSALEGDVVLLYGDVLFKRYILHELLASPALVTLVVDGSRDFLTSGKPADRVKVSGPPPEGYDESEFHLVAMSGSIPDAEVDGEWIGIARTRGEGTELLRETLEEIAGQPGGDGLELSALFNHLVDKRGVAIRVLYIRRDWIDIDELSDVAGGDVAEGDAPAGGAPRAKP